MTRRDEAMPAQVTGVTITVAQLNELTCAICGAPAVCVGRYDIPEDAPPEPACDSCCGHGCEDGRCYHIRDDDGDPDPDALDWCADAINAHARETNNRALEHRRLHGEPRKPDINP